MTCAEGHQLVPSEDGCRVHVYAIDMLRCGDRAVGHGLSDSCTDGEW